MHIIQVSNNIFPVKKYGGVPRVIYYLSDELEKLGHKVTLICKSGSYHENPNISLVQCDNHHNLSKCLPRDADIVHFHGPQLARQSLGVPYIVTLHGNMRSYKDITGLKNVVGISNSHMISHRCNRFVYNGLPSSKFKFEPSGNQDSFLFLSSITPKAKGVAKAIYYATLKNEKLNIAGGYRRDIFNRFPIATALSVLNGTKFHGQVDDNQKQDLLHKAKALLFPISWQEPFGLVMIESLFCGTPVIAYNYGSVPEIISPEAGFVANKRRTFLEAMDLIETIDRKKCREHAVKYFDSSVMAKNYVDCYTDVLSGNNW